LGAWGLFFCGFSGYTLRMKILELGYSPCPNDTYIFHALANGFVEAEEFCFGERLEDVETLNYLAKSGKLDVTKVSFGAISEVWDDYVLLRSGAALGRGCGPLVVSRNRMDMASLRGRRIAVPGEKTTAFLLLRLFDPALAENAVVMSFDLIMEAVKEGEVDAGLIIHEGRFTYPSYGLTELLDLGAWWEQETGLPIPLGGIIAKRTLDWETLVDLEQLIRTSLEFANANPEASVEYIKSHAQEMDEEVIRQHIGLYVNEFSLELGAEGEAAVSKLFSMARERGLVDGPERNLFIE